MKKARNVKQYLEQGYQNLLNSTWAQRSASLNDGCNCMLTALFRGDGTYDESLDNKARVFLAKACVGESFKTDEVIACSARIIDTNDAPDFTRAKALARYRKAIKLASKGK